ncbi:MAG: TonB-dependent receptor, partial [Bacteroidia bacterium]|nr:TonB-dependent receptor [Bacteroidia bacterium]
MKRIFYLLLLLAMMGTTPLSAQDFVSGIVVDAEQTALNGATVLVFGTARGVITDANGAFRIQAAPSDSLVVTYFGYKTTGKTVGSQTTFTFVLDANEVSLDEVVVIGYGVQKKSEVTGAISKVTADDLTDYPVGRVEAALQGRTSGVRVTTNSGQPGAASVVRVRGTTSINGSEPLYVVDGVPVGGGIDYLNSGDIESIEVLKDAASASIYGTRAANGVILVTTKRGKAGKMEVNYNGYYGVQSPWKKLSVLNATEYATLMNEASVAAGGNILFPDPQSLGEGTDWQEAVFNYNAPIQNHEVSISAGSERSSYYSSFGYYDQTGIVSEEDSRYQRFSARFNSTHKINQRLTFGNTIGYSHIKSTGVAENTEFGSPLGRAINLDPITPIYETDPAVLSSSVFTNFPVVSDENGVFGISPYVTSEILNPLAALKVANGFGWSDKIVGNAFAEVKIIEGLVFRSTIGVDLAFYGGEGFTPVFYLNAANRVDVNNYSRNKNNGLLWNWENTLSYARSFGNHSISAVAGTTAQKNAGEGIGGTVYNLPVNTIEEASFGFATDPTTQTFYGFEYQGTLASLLGRVTYSYAGKYLLSATLRRDGSSRFGANNKYGYFPGVSVGWVLTEEAFLKQNDVINFLKIRGSYGVNGSDNIGDFRYVSTVGGARNYTLGAADLLVNGVSPNAIANPDLRWEQTSQINVGFDARFLKNFSLTVDFFDKKTSDMLLGISVPGYVGNGGPIGNVADMRNTGVEGELGYATEIKNVGIAFSGNLSYVENEVVFLGDDRDFLPGATFSPQGLQLSRTEVGFPIGFFYGYKTDGLFQNEAEVSSYTNGDGDLLQPDASPGDIRFVDFNEDGVIDDDDRTMIGDGTPSWTYGFNLDLTYRGFDIKLFSQGVAGVDVYKATRRFDLQMANLTSDALGRWTGEGTSNDYPRLIMNDPNRNFSRSSDFYVEKGDFFRIKTLQLGYTLPKAVVNRLNIQRLRVYVSGNNLLTITQYSGFDPEIGAGFGVDRGIYPQARSFMTGA